MLLIPYIRENKELVIDRLGKRNFRDAETLIQAVLDKDSAKRATQTELDQILAESNKLSKEIGQLFKSGEVQKANSVKEKTAALKEKSKALSEKRLVIETELTELAESKGAAKKKESQMKLF